MNKYQRQSSKHRRVIVNTSPKVCILSLVRLNMDGRTLRQIKTLSQQGYEVTIIHHQKEPMDNLGFRNNVKAIGIHVVSHRLPKFSIFHLVMYFEFCLKSAYAAIQERADVYQGNNLDGLLPAFVAAISRKACLVYDAKEIFTDMQGVKPKIAWRILEALFLKRVDITLNVNRERAKLQQQRYGLIEEPVVIMNCPEICPPENLDRNTLRKRLEPLGLGQRMVVIYQGAIMRGRYLDNLIRAMKYVESDALLVLMGPDNSYRNELYALADNDRIAENRVVFLDPIPPSEIVSFVSGADLGVLFYENKNLNNYYCAPTKLYEYLMAGLPILVNDMPHLKAIVSEDRVGKVVDAESLVSIAQGIDEMLKDRKEIAAMCRQAREIACDRYNWETQANIYLNAIRSTI